mgnify:CR=1 FL=1
MSVTSRIDKMKRKKVALVLGGGGSRGAYEAGVWQALTELGIPIHIVTGTSVGAINGAMVVQGDLELTLQLWREMETHMVFDVPEGSQPIEYAREIVFNHGAGTSGLKELLEKYIDEEAIQNSPVEYGIPVVALPGFEAHYLYKEDMPPGKLIDYIIASASAFPAIHSYEIDGVDYIDGGYVDEIPVSMAVKKGATHVIAVNLKGMGLIRHESLRNAPNLTYIEPKWDLGNILVFDKDNARRILRLGYLDTMKAFHAIDGDSFFFVKGTFDKPTIRMADSCAKLFDLDPMILYTKEVFLDAMSEAVVASQEEMQEALRRYRSLADSLKMPAQLRNTSDRTLLISHLKSLLSNVKNIANPRVLAFLIAYNLKENGVDSIFISRTALRLMPDLILAARFLVKYDLLTRGGFL